MTAKHSSRRRGRRPVGEDTRAALLAAAVEVFGEQGFDGATVRAIAARAGVDAAMVNHWFGGKQGLFLAAVEVPFDPTALIEGVLAGDEATLAERVVRTFVMAWDAHRDHFMAVVRSVASQRTAARLLRDFVTQDVIGRITRAIGADRPDLRTSLCATQLIGLGMMRYVLKLEPLASADVDDIVRAVAPTLQRYLTGEIGS